MKIIKSILIILNFLILAILFYMCEAPEDPERDNPIDTNSDQSVQCANLVFPEDGKEMAGSVDQVTWTDRENASRYWVQISIDSLFTQLVIDQETINDNAYFKLTNVDFGFYYWRVAIVNKYGVKGEFCEFRSFSKIHPRLRHSRRAYGLVKMNEKLYSIAGIGIIENATSENSLETMETYSTQLSDTRWTDENVKMNYKISHGAMETILTKMYYAGGLKQKVSNNVDATNLYPVNELWAFDPNFGTWSRKENLPVALSHLTINNVKNNLYAIGGKDEDGKPTDKVYKYVPDDKKWTEIAQITKAVYGHNSVVVNDKIYFMGGNDGSTYLTNMYVFDPEDNSTKEVASMPPPGKSDFAAVIYEDKNGNSFIYAIGGNTSDGVTSSMSIYNVKDDVWGTGFPMLTARSEIQADILEDQDGKVGIYIPGGYTEGTDPSTNVVEVYYIDQQKWKP